MEKLPLMDITKEEATEMAKLAGVNLLAIAPIYDRGNAGFRISYENILGEFTVSTRKKITDFNLPLSEVIHRNFYPY